MKYQWQLPPKNIDVSDELLAATGFKPILAKLLAIRGITDAEFAASFLDASKYKPAPAHTLHDLEKGGLRLEKAIEQNERVLVWGDFDVDGQTSTALLVDALRGLGGNIDYHIPVRAKESHGIKPAFLKPYLEEGIQVLLSCDTGIGAVDATALANEYGVDVVITDHHDLPAKLPDAYALIDPKFHEESHPLYSLPGVGVAYKVVEWLYHRADRKNELHRFLDLVAMGIVADIAHQTLDTRYLLQLGMEVLKNTSRVGLQAIMQLGKVNPDVLIDENIGFQIGPRLNAVGRLDDANISVELLTTDDAARAAEIASQLEDLNIDRKYKTKDVYDSAVALVKREPSLLNYAALVLANRGWHQGVIGIVASRLVEDYGKPVILLAMPEGKPAGGSARSIDGYHITEAIASQSEYLLGFGGHPMAAGMALDAANIDRFRRGVSKAIIEQRTGGEPVPTLEISLDLPLEEITDELMEEVERLAPFGAGNPPVNYLCRNVKVKEDRLLGKDKSHRKLLIADESDTTLEVIWWGGAGELMPEGELDIVFRMRPSYFQGQRQKQVTLVDVKRADRQHQQVQSSRFVIEDYREASDPVAMLAHLKQKHEDVAIWGEVQPAVEGMKNRLQVQPAQALAIWTIPPDRASLNDVLQRVRPQKLFMFNNDPEMDSVAVFLKRLVGLAKYTLVHYGGKTKLEKLAAATGQTPAAVRLGLQQLGAVGIVASEENGNVNLDASEKKKSPDDASLRALLKESAAFRRALREPGVWV